MSVNVKLKHTAHGIDLQYVVKGTERFGKLLQQNIAEPITEYKPDVTF